MKGNFLVTGRWDRARVVRFAFALALVFACGSSFAEGRASLAEGRASLAVTPGTDWAIKVWMGVVPVSLTPQYAAWIETVDGKYVETVMVTSRASRGTWRGNPKGGRPDALPVWSHASQSSRADVDAATSATPEAESSITASAGSLVSGTEYVVRFEVNHSFDYNDAWPKGAKKGSAGYSGVNGQPSLVYEGKFVAGRDSSVSLEPVGHGSVDGSDGSMTRSLAGFTGALSIVKGVTLTVTEK